MPVKRPQFQVFMLHPRYWLTWLGFCLLWLIAQLPYSVLMALGRGLGRLLLRVAKSRRKVAARNFELCFPELSQRERDQLLTKNFESTAIALFESAMAWWWPKKRLEKLVQYEGMENLENLNGQGVLMLGFHFTTLDIAGAFMNLQLPITAMYRPHKNAVYDFVQRKGRERFHKELPVVERRDVRGMAKVMKSGDMIWYAPDQDYGRKGAEFVPFFGIPAATLTATSKFAQLGQAKVIPITYTRLPNDQGYRMTIHQAFDNFPTGDDYTDTARVMAFAETRIREQPEQYLWTHRRFKNRPQGETSLY
ncbi:MAG: LpxL/LpxP family Kdo(2)-lipid IV(A) lauroyl/palmitoleoyl acyltransferase [Cellvibrionaceae bacterium]